MYPPFSPPPNHLSRVKCKKAAQDKEESQVPEPLQYKSPCSNEQDSNVANYVNTAIHEPATYSTAYQPLTITTIETDNVYDNVFADKAGRRK